MVIPQNRPWIFSPKELPLAAKHSSYIPKSTMLPSNNPGDIFDEESITEIVKEFNGSSFAFFQIQNTINFKFQHFETYTIQNCNQRTQSND